MKKLFTLEHWNKFTGGGPRLSIGTVVKLSDQYSGGTDHRNARILGYTRRESVANLTVNGETFGESDFHEVYEVELFNGDKAEKSVLWPDELEVISEVKK
jgi:hypothetical protein